MNEITPCRTPQRNHEIGTGVASDVIGYPITSLATPVPISWFLCGVLHGVISFMPRPFRRC
ncbi:hypothetical protein QSV01_10285, partial [Bifidobacterium longum]|uniref:hypothetical protein n=1 Tax=Bifidobacterium longum TaxID=216816 RepID=UPI002570AC4E